MTRLRGAAAINAAAAETGVDAQLIRSIMYVEQTQGYYDRLPALFDMNSSILPMNVRSDLWGPRLGYTRDQLKDPGTNIMAGARILQQLITEMPAGTGVAEIATRYNNGNAGLVSDYGARVAEVYRTRAWTAPSGIPNYGCAKAGVGC